MIVVEFSTIEDFLAELRDAPQRIADKTVRCEIARTPEQAERVSFEVTIFMTSVQKGDEQYLLELMSKVGTDQLDADDMSGSNAAYALRTKLEEHCDDLGLVVKAGKIEPF